MFAAFSDKQNQQHQKEMLNISETVMRATTGLWNTNNE